MTQADYALQQTKGIKKSFDNAIQEQIQSYFDNRIIDFYETSEVSEIFTSTEGLKGSKELSSLETPPSLALEDGYSVTLVEKRFGGAIVIPEGSYRRDGQDMTMKVDAYLQRQRNQLLKDNMHLLLTRAFLMINEAFDSGSDYLAPDGVELIGSHSWASGDTFDNSATAVLSEGAIDTAMEYGGAFKDPSGKEMPLNFDTIIVKKGSAAERTAKRLYAFGIQPTQINDINIYFGEMIIVASPYILSSKKLNWFLRDSSLENPVIVGIGENPTMREPKIQDNEAIRSNVTGFWKQGIANIPFSWYGSTGAN